MGRVGFEVVVCSQVVELLGGHKVGLLVVDYETKRLAEAGKDPGLLLSQLVCCYGDQPVVQVKVNLDLLDLRHLLNLGHDCREDPRGGFQLKTDNIRYSRCFVKQCSKGAGIC